VPNNKSWLTRWRDLLLALLTILSFIALTYLEPIAQNLAYHNFADKRTILNINNFFDVASNLPFLLVGILGLHCIFKNWGIENDTLTWDRLPMAVGFMALFVIAISDYVHSNLEKWLLIPMCMIGVISVAYWHITDDLRLYAWVQFISMALLLVIISLYKPNTLQTKYILYAFVFYILSKLAEHFASTSRYCHIFLLYLTKKACNVSIKVYIQ